MALKAAIIMSIISIAMLVTYGGDVISAGNDKTGFLHMDPSIRGSIFGIIPSAMLIISYFITRKEHNKKIGGLIMAGGILIIAGIGIIFAIQGSTDRKSTRLNSSHLVISYAVFCLKKKKTR